MTRNNNTSGSKEEQIPSCSIEETQTAFEEAKQEINLYLSFLENFEKKPQPVTKSVEEAGFEKSQLFPILKANFIVLLYACLEAHFMMGIKSLLKAYKDENLPLRELAEKVQMQEFLYEYNSMEWHKVTAQAGAERIQKWTLLPNLPSGALNHFYKSEGNLTGETIRMQFERYGIPVEHDKKGCLVKIKEIRNKLVHGNISFYDAGHTKTVPDLTTLRTDCFTYLDKILLCIKKFIDTKQYLKNPPAAPTS